MTDRLDLDDDPRVGWRGDPGDLLAALDEPADFVRRLQALRPDWIEHAACRGMETTLFFPSKGQTNRAALEVCGGCSVRTQCLDEAIADDSLDHGIRGGMTAPARKAHRRAEAARTRKRAAP